MHAPAAATPREKLPETSGQPVKASLRPQVPATRLRDVAAEALQQATSQKAAALDIDISEGRLSQLETLGPQYAVKFGEQLIEQFAPLATPIARARQQVKEARRALDEIEQALEVLAS